MSENHTDIMYIGLVQLVETFGIIEVENLCSHLTSTLSPLPHLILILPLFQSKSLTASERTSEARSPALSIS